MQKSSSYLQQTKHDTQTTIVCLYKVKVKKRTRAHPKVQNFTMWTNVQQVENFLCLSVYKNKCAHVKKMHCCVDWISGVSVARKIANESVTANFDAIVHG